MYHAMPNIQPNDRFKLSDKTGVSTPETSAIAPVHTPGLASTQRASNFGRLAPQKPSVIHLMRECYELEGNEEIGNALGEIIDDLARKAEKPGWYSFDEIKPVIVWAIKHREKGSDVVVANKTAKQVNPIRSPEDSILQEVQQLASEKGFIKKLELLKGKTQTDKITKELTSKISAQTQQIKSLDNLDEFNTILNEVEKDLGILSKFVGKEKARLVENLRKTDLDNRQQDKLIVEKRGIESRVVDKLSSERPDPGIALTQKMQRRLLMHTLNSRAKHDAALSNHKILQGQLSDSVQLLVLPIYEPTLALSHEKLNALSDKMIDLEKREQDKIPELKKSQQAAGSKDEFDGFEKQIDAVNKTIQNIKGYKNTISKLKVAKDNTNVEIEFIKALRFQIGNVGNAANILPFSAPLLANAEALPLNEEGFSLTDGLRYGRTGVANHAVPRALALRTNLAELGSHFKEFENMKTSAPGSSRGDKRSSLVDLGATLHSENKERVNNFLEYLGTQSGRLYVHRLAASNLIAAGFNTETLNLDAPSLAYKVESGFNSVKKLKVGRTGVYARDPQEHLGTRLTVMSRISKVLQNELFRDGKTVNIEHAITTPQHAVEFSSLVLLAIPNELLTVNHREVTGFMKSVKEFESEIQAAVKDKRSVDSEKLSGFKQTLTKFYKDASVWVARRDAAGPERTVAMAHQISTEIATKGRKGIFRRASASLGNLLNLAGGRIVMESFSSFRTYFRQTNAKERLRQQFVKPENLAFIADLKMRLQGLKNKDDRANAQALIRYLDGESLRVELKGDLSSDMIKITQLTGEFLHRAWQPISKGRPLPAVIGLSASQIKSIPDFANSKLSQFTAGTPSQAQPENISNPIPATFKTKSDNQWVASLWASVLNEGKSPSESLAKLKDDFQLNFADIGIQALPSLDEIAKYAGRPLNGIPNSVIEKMEEMTPLLLTARRGFALQGQLTQLGSRTLNDVSNKDNRCWLRASWGAAVNNLSREEFSARLGAVLEPIRADLGSNMLSTNEIGQIYDQIKKTPLEGLQAQPPLENKQRAVMIALMDQADESWKTGTVKDSLQSLKENNNPQTEGDFGVVLLNALNLPVIIHRDHEEVPDLYLPQNFKVNDHGHPDVWPTLRYDGNGSAGHWQFYPQHVM